MRWYYRKLADGLVIAHARPEFAGQLEELQRICFPTLAEEERFKSRHYLKHMELFDERTVRRSGWRSRDRRNHHAAPRLRFRSRGSHVRRDHPGRLADVAPTRAAGGCTAPTSAFIRNIEAAVSRQRFMPRGRKWCGGSELKGQVTAGMIPGYGAVKDTMSAEEYYEACWRAGFAIPRSIHADERRVSSRAGCSRITSTIRSATTTASCSCSTPRRTCGEHRRRTPCPIFD